MLSKKVIYVNVDKQWVTTSQGFKLRIDPVFYTNSNYFIEFYLKDENNNPIDLTGYTFKCGIDYQLGDTHTDIALSDNDMFNIYGTNYSLSTGYINCKLKCDNILFPTYMTDNEQNTGYFNLWGLSPTNQKVLFTQFKVRLRNPISKQVAINQQGIGYWIIGDTFIVDTTS